MTMFELLPASAGARVIATGSGKGLLPGSFFLVQDTHDVCRGTPVTQFIDHHPHRAVDVQKERLVSTAQVIEERLPLFRHHYAIFGTPTIAYKANFTINTLLGQLSEFIASKGALLF